MRDQMTRTVVGVPVVGGMMGEQGRSDHPALFAVRIGSRLPDLLPHECSQTRGEYCLLRPGESKGLL